MTMPASLTKIHRPAGEDPSGVSPDAVRLGKDVIEILTSGMYASPIYDQFQYDVGAEVLRDGQLIEDDAEEILKRLMRLVQIASNFPHEFR